MDRVNLLTLKLNIGAKRPDKFLPGLLEWAIPLQSIE